MHRTGPAERNERQGPQVDRAFSGMHPGRAGHVLRHDAMDPPSRRFDVQPERVGHAADRRLGEVAVEGHRAAQEVARIEVSQDEVGVGDGRLVPPRP